MGERWYQLRLREQHLGYWHTNTFTDNSGRWVFESEQRFALNPGDPVTITTRRTFAAKPPHSLVVAESIQARRSSSQRVRGR